MFKQQSFSKPPPKPKPKPKPKPDGPITTLGPFTVRGGPSK